jgi:hypothetical protein
MKKAKRVPIDTMFARMSRLVKKPMIAALHRMPMNAQKMINISIARRCDRCLKGLNGKP